MSDEIKHKSNTEEIKQVSKRSLLLKVLAITAVAASAIVLLNKKKKKNRYRKEALAYEVW